MGHIKTLKAIIFDFDDTIIDTYSYLITPLESIAAQEMVTAGSQERDPKRLARLLLKLRREHPSHIEKELLRYYPNMKPNILAARERVFSNINLDRLTIDPEVVQMIQELSARYYLYLVTSGETEFQNRKIDHLKIRNLFHEVSILDSRSNRDKKSLFKFLIENNNYSADSVLIVGNRIDEEIYAGNELGMVTVLVKYGEGSEIKLGKKTDQPDYTIKNIIQLQKILTRFESHFRD